MSAFPREVAGRYTVRSPIGEGAYSVTYRAIDTALQRDVAIKVLREQYAAHEGFDSRFEREARSAARISHPNVISVYDYGRQGHLPYIIMQFVDGPNLKEYVREEGPLTVEESISFARQILDGLSAIHDEGIIHRDVKPQNVLIDEGMQAKITDFGVAFVTVDPGLTETGMAVGTAAYMAPEQASGEAVGPQADLYAVGVILYELLTGRLPFPGDNPVQVMYRHVNEMPEPPRSINRSVPLGVEAVVLKALAKDAHDRFPDARTMRDALMNPGSSIAQTAATPIVEQPAQSRTGETPRVVVSPPRRRQPPRRAVTAPRPSNWPVVLLLLLVVGLVVILLLLLQSGRFQGFAGVPDATPTRQSAIVPGVLSSPTMTPDASDAALVVPADPVDTDDPEPAPEEPTDVVPPDEQEAASTPEPDPGPPDGPAETTAADEDAGPPPASSQFNSPFDGRLLPPAWNSGTSVSLTVEQFQAAGAAETDERFPAPGALVTGRVDVEFNALSNPSQHIGILMAAMQDDGPGETPIRISLNGNVIWSGPAPFIQGEWTETGWRVGNLDWLETGTNVFTIEVLSTNGALLISNTTIYYR